MWLYMILRFFFRDFFKKCCHSFFFFLLTWRSGKQTTWSPKVQNSKKLYKPLKLPKPIFSIFFIYKLSDFRKKFPNMIRYKHQLKWMILQIICCRGWNYLPELLEFFENIKPTTFVLKFKVKKMFQIIYILE